jgi:hypothetical protein
MRVVQKWLGLWTVLYDTGNWAASCQHRPLPALTDMAIEHFHRRWQQWPSATSCSKSISEFSHTLQWTRHRRWLLWATLDCWTARLLWKEGVLASDIHCWLTAVCGKAAPGGNTVFQWTVSFNTRIESVEKGAIPGQPAAARTSAALQCAFLVVYFMTLSQ